MRALTVTTEIEGDVEEAQVAASAVKGLGERGVGEFGEVFRSDFDAREGFVVANADVADAGVFEKGFELCHLL